MKIVKLIILSLILTLTSFAQIITAKSSPTGQVLDPQGNPYAAGTIDFELAGFTCGVPPPIMKSVIVGLDGSGNIPSGVQLVDNTGNCPGSQYNITVCNGTRLICFSTLQTITGATPSLTSALQSAPSLNLFSNTKALSFSTAGNCSSGGASGTASPAACVGAAAGKIAVPASQTTYTVNSTVVTAGSVIILTQTTDNTGLSGSPACSATTAQPILQSARVAATSFTFALTSVAAVTCFYYWVIN